MAKSTLHLGELFSGPGGIGYGAHLASNSRYRLQTRWAIDNDPDSCETYRQNVSGNVRCEDVRALDFEQLDPIDGLTFGFPCNDFSQVGKQKGLSGDYGPLYTYGVKALQHFQPRFFLAENVTGLTTGRNRDTYKRILTELKDSGYQVTPHVYRFEQYGVPQARHWVILVGIRNDITARYEIPEPVGDLVTAREALENPPISADVANHELPKHNELTVERLEHIKPGENAFTAVLPDRLQINTKTRLSQIYRRLDPTKPAYTLTGSGGGGTHVYHYREPRALTNRERARLQTFPDDFTFMGGRESVRRQIGMAVPPRGAQIIFESILNALETEG